MQTDSQGTNCATEEVTHGCVCQLELDVLASDTLTKGDIEEMICTTQEHMHETQSVTLHTNRCLIELHHTSDQNRKSCWIVMETD